MSVKTCLAVGAIIIAGMCMPAVLPTISEVAPNTGAATGGTAVTIHGANMGGATAVRFGATKAKSFKVESSSVVSAVAPAGFGTVDVTVTTQEGTSQTGSTDRFTYEATTISNTIHGPYVVRSGQAVVLASTGKITGPVTVEAGGALDIQGGTTTGPLTATDAAALRFCGGAVSGPVKVTAASGSVVIGDGTSGCAGNTITGPVAVTDTQEGVVVAANHISGSLSVTGNEGGTRVIDNSISGSLTVTGNGGAVVDEPNEASGQSRLQ